MPYGNSTSTKCCECGEEFPHLKKLSGHIKKIHCMSSLDYVVKHQCDGLRPTCKVCGSETRFVSLGEGFKAYCSAHAHVAESVSGRMGGKKKRTWNKGLTKSSDQRLATIANNSLGENNPFFGHHHTDETIKRNADAHRLSFNEVISRVKEALPDVVVVSGEDAYEDQNSLLQVRCSHCNVIDDVSSRNLQNSWRCRTCHPLASRPLLEIVDYVRSFGLDVEVSTRKVIAPLELDIYVPEKNVAIEYHGLYWHSGGKDEVFDKRRHRQKYELCLSRGIRLIQIFSDEWTNRRDVCMSIISNAVGANCIKLNARDCELVDVPREEADAFADNSHIAGHTRCKHRFGLVHPKYGLVGLATTRTPIQKKWGNVCELARMCFLRGCSVRGGASKLLTRVKCQAMDDDFDGVLSYADLRLGVGGVYEQCGFKLVGESPMNYWYTDGTSRFDRFSFRARPGKPEKQVAEENGVRPVWGCGNRIYLWKP